MLSTVRAAEGVGEGPAHDVVVSRWGGRETLALRQALRLSPRGFAEHLGIATATVGSWESKGKRAALGLAMQAVLDDALKLAEVEARIRFRSLVLSSPFVTNTIASPLTASESPLRQS